MGLPAHAQTRVACVGDSITEGYGLTSPSVDAYPAQLQSLLGSDYEVVNFGVSGSTTRKQGDKPYWNQAAYTQSSEFAPNIVLLMLGTNDAKVANWNEASFRNDYIELVEHYRALNAEVVVASPPKVFASGAFDINPATVNDTLAPLIGALATELDVAWADVFAETQAHPEWFPDNVHPTREGATAIAETFASQVRAIEAAATSAPPNTAPSGSSSSTENDTQLSTSAAVTTSSPFATTSATATATNSNAHAANPTQPDPSSTRAQSESATVRSSDSTSPLSDTWTNTTRAPTTSVESKAPLSRTNVDPQATEPTSASSPERASGCSLASRITSAPSSVLFIAWCVCGLFIRRAKRGSW